MTPKNFFEAAQNFPSTVAPGTNEVPLEVELQPYDVVFPKGFTPPPIRMRRMRI